MSFRERTLQLIENDNTIYRLLLLGLLIAGPSLHYLCFTTLTIRIWLRVSIALLSAVALGIVFTAVQNRIPYSVYTHHI
jgi:two-component system sensor histidine kinase/response regulator